MGKGREGKRLGSMLTLHKYLIRTNRRSEGKIKANTTWRSSLSLAIGKGRIVLGKGRKRERLGSMLTLSSALSVGLCKTEWRAGPLSLE